MGTIIGNEQAGEYRQSVDLKWISTVSIGASMKKQICQKYMINQRQKELFSEGKKHEENDLS